MCGSVEGKIARLFVFFCSFSIKFSLTDLGLIVIYGILNTCDLSLFLVCYQSIATPDIVFTNSICAILYTCMETSIFGESGQESCTAGA